MTGPRGGHLPHQPALDGVRGLAVLAVLVLHAGPASWLPGGFLGVSLFFTLSGYLIGSLVLAEVEGGGGLALARFWARRVRRLVPALVLTVLGVVVMSRFVDLPSSTRSELLGGLGYVANWVQIAGGESYAALFESPSAAVHLWSLAIEEQFYVVFPFLAWLAARRGPGGLGGAFVVGGLVVAGAGLALTAAVDDQVFAYYATLTRVPEIAVGVVAAGWWPLGRVAGWWRDRPVGAGRGPMIAANLAGGAALVVTVVLWRTTDLADGWVYGGGLVLLAVVSVVLVVAAGAPGPLATVLGVWPLRGLGTISYGLYLYHWPVVVLVAAPRVDLAPVALFGARSAVSIALAVASYHLVEQPIRRARLGPAASPVAVIGAGLAVLVATAVVVVFGVAGGGAGQRPPARPAPAVVGPGAPADVPGSTGAPSGPSVPVVALFGDSLPNWLVRDGGWVLDPAEVVLVDGTIEGCDGAEGAPVGRAGTGVVVSVPEACTGWRTLYPPVLAARPVDVAILVVGTGAVMDRQLDGAFVGPCEAPAQRWYGDDVRARLRYLGAEAERVVLVLPAWAEDWSGWVFPADHVARTDCVRATLRAAAADVAGGGTGVAVVDLAEHLCPDGPERCRPVRSVDGVHIDPDEAGGVLDWIVASARG
jgi:peptidoglycan/LPS O-acetylase OafA/YrhL